MKQFKQFFVLILMTLFSVSVWGDVKTDVMCAKGFGGYTTNSYSAAGTDKTGVANLTDNSGATYAMQVFNGSTGAVRGNQSGSGNFSCRNTTTYSGYYISQVQLTVSGGTIDGSTNGRSVVYFGSSAYANPTTAPTGSSTAASPSSSGQSTLTWTNSDEDVSYFILYNLKTAGTALCANASTSLTVTWTQKSGGGSTPSLSADPTVIDFGKIITGASVASKTVAVEFENLTGSVTYSAISSPFSASGSINASGDEITISADASVVGTYQETLTIQSAADSKSVNVTVKMQVADPTGTFELFDGDIDEGDYVLYYSGKALKNTVASNRLGYLEVTPSEDKIINPDEAIIWHIAESGEYWTLYNAAVDKFAGGTNTKNQGALLADASTNMALWTVTGSSTYEFENYGRSLAGTDSGNKWLRNNGTNGFACYATGTGGALTLYKKSDGKQSAGLAYDDEDLSNLVKLGSAFTAPTLTNPHSLTVAYESSNTSVAEVNASTGALTIKAVGVAEITASFAGDEDYKAGSAQYALYVVAHDGTEADPYTVADARVVIDKVGETGIADKYATGIVSKIVTAFNPTYGNITYDISSDGTTESAQLRAYRGFDKDGEWFTSEDDVLVGDEVVVKGTIKKYLPSTYEFEEGNQLISLSRTKAAAGLEYAETAIEKNIGDAAFTNTLTNPNSLDVTYSSTAVSVATVDENGEVTIVGMGTTTIKASFAGNASYLADEVSYTLTVSDPSLTKVTFDATIDKTTADDELSLTKGDLTIEVSSGRFNNSTDYRIYKNAVFTVSCATGNIKRLEFTTTGGSSYAASGFGGDVVDGVWSGNTSNVELTASGNQVRISKLVVYYEVDTRAEAGLEYAETAIVKTIGDAVFVNALTNPNGVTVTYESSDADVAEVASDGTVTIKALGTATITATFAGNASYKPATISYNITVNEPGLASVTFDSSVDHAASGETTITKGGFTLSFTSGSMDGTQAEYRLYKGQTMTLSSTDYFIKKIEFTCTAGNPIDGFEDAAGLDKANNQWTGETNTVELTASGAQVRITQLVVYYVEDTRAASGLAWSTDAIEIDLGETFTPANLVNPNSIAVGEISIESSNTDLATVTAGVVSLEPDVLGTATITATFAGNASYKPATFSYTITVTDPTPVISTTPASLNWGTVNKDAAAETKTITVSFHNVAAATATLGGTNPTAYSIDKTSLVDGDVITVSVASTATEGTFPAKLIITDNAGVAANKEVSLSLKIEEAETPVSTSSKWVAATEIVDGMEVLITGVKDEETYAMGGQNSNNRAAVAGSLEAGVFTPGENTMAFTVVAQEGGTYALQTSNGNYLYAASNTNNYLRSKAELDDNGKWTLTIASAVANGTNSHNIMQFNGSSALFSCYNAESQAPIALYVRTKLPATVTAADMEVVAGASKAIAFTTNNTENPDVAYVVESGSENICLFKGAITGVKAGTATVRVTIAETENYTSASDEFTVTVSTPLDPAKAIEKIGGKFIINAHGDTAVFSRGNLRYNVATEQWYCADKQYDFVGENGNLHFGDANYKGEFDLFGWSCTSSNYGLLTSNHDEDFTGDFIDWGGLFTSGEDEWSSLSKEEMTYIIAHHQWTTLILDPTPADADNEDEIVGLALFPLGWAQPAGFESLHYSLCDWNEEAKFADNTFALTAWDDLEAAGAVFLPMAGARAGHWGNNWNGSAVDPRKNPNPNGGNSYCFVDNIRWYGYYWLNTPHPTSVKSASYLIFPGWSEGPTTADDDDLYLPPVVWSREKRRGNSVRLVTRKPRIPGYVRTEMLGNGVLGTVCVDHNVAINDAYGATFYELVGREAGQGKIVFDEIVSGQLEAGVPYLFQSTGEDLVLYYGTTKVDNPVNTGNGMYGTFSAITLTDLNDVYYFAQKALWGCSDLTSLSVPANRAYVKLSEVNTLSDPNPAPGRRRITMNVNGEQIATGLWDVDGSENAPRKVLFEGTLYILRGEKVYDTTGRLVK